MISITLRSERKREGGDALVVRQLLAADHTVQVRLHELLRAWEARQRAQSGETMEKGRTWMR